MRTLRASAALATLMAISANAQVTPAAGYTPPDDTPSFKIGATIYGDYTYQSSPTTKDADGNDIHPSSFNISRAYINVTGNLNHLISFRITPDVARESGSGSSLSGSQTFRIKYGYGQLNLNDWTTQGSWIRLGVQQTPYLDYTENLYRYRFQGAVFPEREGYITSSDAGLSGRYVFPGNYGELHAGFYNGEGYTKAEANSEKAFQVRATVRPMPLGGIWKGLRVTGFYIGDHYVSNAKRQRAIGQLTFESDRVNAGFDAQSTKDRTSVKKAEVSGRGWSAWVTPKLPRGWEILYRHDELTPDRSISSQKRKRDIVGLAYWAPNLNKVSSALMIDYDSLRQSGFSPPRPRDTKYGLKMLINF